MTPIFGLVGVLTSAMALERWYSSIVSSRGSRKGMTLVRSRQETARPK